MIIKRILAVLATVMLGTTQVCYAELPLCSNRIINEVTTRVGCTVGDSKCWLTKGGMCTDYIQKMISRGQPGKTLQLARQVRPEDVRKGDVAQFNARVHYAYVESVVRDKSGKPVAVNVSEYNYGACWVDRDTMVTNKYKKVNRRSGIPLSAVDGGFWRP
ncbi:MAG: hypothetical protein M0Z67_11965 [Nitrospiraceae bacterium]|nr:hypothetical protein [Nitrospiraceae bacterium]